MATRRVASGDVEVSLRSQRPATHVPFDFAQDKPGGPAARQTGIARADTETSGTRYAPSDPAVKSRPSPYKITRHTMSSKFRRISNKTNDRCPHQVTHFLDPSHVDFRTNSALPGVPIHRDDTETSGNRYALRANLAVFRPTNHESPLTNHAFLIDTPAIRNDHKSNHPSADLTSNRNYPRARRKVRRTAECKCARLEGEAAATKATAGRNVPKCPLLDRFGNAAASSFGYLVAVQSAQPAATKLDRESEG
jgi:hypothetical protein